MTERTDAVTPFLLRSTAVIALLAALAGPAAAQDPATAPAGTPATQPEGQPPAEAAPDAADPAAPDAAAPEAAAAEAAAPEAAEAPAPLTDGLAGPYLAARMAAVQNDFAAAARYFSEAVAKDPNDRYLQDSALVALISAGQMDEAVALTTGMDAAGSATELAGLVNRARLAKAGDWAGLIAELDAAPAPAEGEPQGRKLLDGMIRGWAEMGAGRASDALKTFEALTAVPGAQGMVNYHLALARAMAGDFQGAETLLKDEQTGSHILGFTARAQILAQLDRRDEAIAMLDAIPGIEAEPGLQALRAQLAGDLPVAFDVVTAPRDGIAQVFLTFATALAQGPSPEPEPLALVHARLAAWLAPNLGEARLMAAQLLQSQGQYALAETEFEALRALGAVRPVAELSRIDALSRAGRLDEAEKAALALTAANPDLPQGWIALGDLMRQQEKYAAAVPAYDKALALLAEAPEAARWFPLYARAIALERSDQFDRAEADFRAAIKLRPDQPSLLNYLGYSWIDRNMNLDEGLALIQQAVDLAPEDGYIQDSLAWAFYRLGRYDEAVAPMEKAARSMSNDPLINDHLGDIYWMVGRKREAEIQWRRALSLHATGKADTQDDVEPDRIRAKLDRGLDAVLADEKAGVPLRPAPQPAAQPPAEAPAGMEGMSGMGVITVPPAPIAPPQDAPRPAP